MYLMSFGVWLHRQLSISIHFWKEQFSMDNFLNISSAFFAIRELFGIYKAVEDSFSLFRISLFDCQIFKAKIKSGTSNICIDEFWLKK